MGERSFVERQVNRSVRFLALLGVIPIRRNRSFVVRTDREEACVICEASDEHGVYS